MKLVKTTNPMTVAQIRTEADKSGFIPVTFADAGNEKYIKTTLCRVCGGKMLAFTAKEKGGKFHTAHACPCGSRKFFGYGPDKKPIKFTPKCVGKGCSNTLPADRKKFCYTCRPKHQSVVM